MRPEQVLRTKEGEDSNILMTVTFDGFKPLVHEPVAYDGGQAVILLERRGLFERMANGVDHVIRERDRDLLRRGSCAVFVGQCLLLLLFEIRRTCRCVLLILQGHGWLQGRGGDSPDAFRHSLQSAKFPSTILQNFCDSYWRSDFVSLWT